MVGIRLAGFHGAYFGTLGRCEGPDTVGTPVRVDDKIVFTLRDSLVGALRFACTATDAFFIDTISHYSVLLVSNGLSFRISRIDRSFGAVLDSDQESVTEGTRQIP
jgi:hypothetical protein